MEEDTEGAGTLVKLLVELAKEEPLSEGTSPPIEDT